MIQPLYSDPFGFKYFWDFVKKFELKYVWTLFHVYYTGYLLVTYAMNSVNMLFE